MRIKKLIFMAVLLAISLVIFIVEAQLPQLVPIPGIKLGLANIMTLICIILLGKREAFIILLLRIVLSGIFTGQMAGFLYSLTGGLACFCVMAVLSGYIRVVWVISPIGAMVHNTAQIAVAAVVTQTWQIIFYLPVLLISGTITGIFTGVCASMVITRNDYIQRQFKNLKR